MAYIRTDLEGVVHAWRENGETVILRAGDEIPAGIALGSHLIEPERAVKAAPKAAPRGKTAGGTGAASDEK